MNIKRKIYKREIEEMLKRLKHEHFHRPVIRYSSKTGYSIAKRTKVTNEEVFSDVSEFQLILDYIGRLSNRERKVNAIYSFVLIKQRYYATLQEGTPQRTYRVTYYDGWHPYSEIGPIVSEQFVNTYKYVQQICRLVPIIQTSFGLEIAMSKETLVFEEERGVAVYTKGLENELEKIKKEILSGNGNPATLEAFSVIHHKILTK